MAREYEKYYNAETGEFTPEFEAYFDAVGEHDCPNYDCNQVARAMSRGLSPAECAAECNKEHAEKLRDDRAAQDRDNLDFDYSMNG